MSKPPRLDREDLRRRLEAASGTAGLVRVARHRLEEKTAFSVGYLVGVGERFLLLHVLDDGLDLDGYRALRIKHLTGFETDFPRKAFYEKALALKHQSAKAPEGIALDSAAELLRSIDERFPLLVLHREALHPDECEIGRLRALFEKDYLLHWINPDATWEVDNRRFRYADVTRVDFAGRYEATLALVSGAKPGMVFTTAPDHPGLPSAPPPATPEGAPTEDADPRGPETADGES